MADIRQLTPEQWASILSLGEVHGVFLPPSDVPPPVTLPRASFSAESLAPGMAEFRGNVGVPLGQIGELNVGGTYRMSPHPKPDISGVLQFLRRF